MKVRQQYHLTNTQMTNRFWMESLGWGFILWLVGYVLGILLFAFVPTAIIGWVIMPIGVIITLWVLLKKIQPNSIGYFSLIGLIWALIAVVFDYLLIVKILHPADGYYKLDVYLYYILTFVLPPIVGWYKTRISR